MPTHMYLSRHGGDGDDNDCINMETCTVAPGKKLALDFVVDEPGAVLK